MPASPNLYIIVNVHSIYIYCIYIGLDEAPNPFQLRTPFKPPFIRIPPQKPTTPPKTKTPSPVAVAVRIAATGHLSPNDCKSYSQDPAVE